MKRLLLVGGGHAHLAVLRQLRRQRLGGGVQVTLVSPFAHQTYSGMLPGWMAGHYPLEACQIDLAKLADAADVMLVPDQACGINAEQGSVSLEGGISLEYDLLSVNTGSESRIEGLEGCGKRLLPVRPLDGFLHAWPQILAAAEQKQDYVLAVVGGGAAGVELAFAAQYAFRQRGLGGHVHLVSPKLLQGHAPAVVGRVIKQLHASGIRIHPDFAVGVEGGLQLDSGKFLPADRVLAATGALAPHWLAGSGLALDGEGYIRVSDFHQSASHPNVFAAGDVCSRAHMHFGRSGVHAVYAGLALAHNLPAYLRGGELQAYVPKRRSLYLLATGPKQAIASWGDWSAAGGWVWRWKDHIDTGFIRRHQ